VSGHGATCVACSLADGTGDLPGGPIHERGGWLVEHCVGPLGLGTLIVKPRRHVTAVAELTDDEVVALGPLLRDASTIAAAVAGDDVEQVYHCLWSHAGGVPVHIHYVVQPVTRRDLDRHGVYGPALQLRMFDAGELPDRRAVEAVCDRARLLFAAARPVTP
jgi:diadenosine tetraphosphate (Ap4A) HIT family hydrolase